MRPARVGVPHVRREGERAPDVDRVGLRDDDAALRETSVLFAMLIGALWLGERLTPRRWAAGALILAGVVLMRL